MKEVVQSIRDFNRLYVNLFGILRNNLFDLNYSLTESRVIFEIGNHQELTAKHLKEVLLIDEGYLSRILKSLVKEKLVEKLLSSADKRVYHLSLTPTGKDLLKAINEKSNMHYGELISQLDKTDQLRLGKIVPELKAILSKIKLK